MTIPVEDLLKNIKSRYKLVLVAAQRANELAKGAPSLVAAKSKKVAVTALEEISKGKINYEDRKDAKAKKS